MGGRNRELGKELEMAEKRAEIAGGEKSGTVQQLKNRLEKELTLRAELCSHSRRLAKRVQRMPKIKERTATKARKAGIKSASEISLKDGNGYSAKARELAREIVQYGMPAEKAGEAIQGIGKVLGVTVHEKMSAATVRRAEIEGGVIGDLQLAYEMANSPVITYSSDSTSHKRIEYESRTVAVRVTGEKGDEWKQRTLGVDISTDHSSETQVAGLKDWLTDLSETFSASPFAARTGMEFTQDVFIVKCAGTSGDHAPDQIKGHGIMRSWKDATTETKLAERKLMGLPVTERCKFLWEIQAQRIEELGGKDEWEKLSEDEQHAVDVDILRSIGKEELAKMPEDQRRKLTMFIRTGCSMHKDLNTVKGGDEAMRSWWEASGNQPPIILPNKANAAVLKVAQDNSNPSQAEKQAREASKRGATQLTVLAGLIFKNSDTKKGEQDMYLWWMTQELGYAVPFADVSNTRYGSHGEAACLLIVYRDQYLKFLQHIRYTKDQIGFVNIEENVYEALSKCMPTLTELAIHALYNVLVSQPFMGHVRTHKNILLLGPFFSKKLKLIQSVIDNPELWLGNTVDPKTAQLEGDEFSEWTQLVLGAVRGLCPHLPHILGALIAFMQGAKSTFERFSKEFMENGDITQLTDQEKHDLFLASTNDLNEGALGRLRLNKRTRPNQSLLSHNAHQVYARNGGREFAAQHLTGQADQKYLRKVARARETSGHSRKIKERLLGAKQLKVIENKQREERQQKAEKARQAELLEIGKNLVLDGAKINELTVFELNRQLKYHREAEIKRKSTVKIPATSKLNMKQLPSMQLSSLPSYLTHIRTEPTNMPNKHGGDEMVIAQIDSLYESDVEDF
ncbi:hypothetical protein EST38_g2358 [Candolleomyces aberdarensis]|uniref:Uncharacterized protein n=1 Tax=Candolleomyces aberdarensis TaxID=2316362 RepID=A0A4Q2DVT9_9AGAR|nr:hypothetical protein EST38_g2358 [Candolleomyces aberdarensis]